MNKLEKAQSALKLAAKMSEQYYHKPLIITYSGGKDSDVMLDIAMKCLEPDQMEVLNSHTTVDAPQTVYHIRNKFKELNGVGIRTQILQPTYKGEPITMWTLIPQKSLPPTRIVRYCCSVLKEASTPNRVVALGVRQAESSKRQGRDTFGTRGVIQRSEIFFPDPCRRSVRRSTSDGRGMGLSTHHKRKAEQGSHR